MSARAAEAEALVALGIREELRAPLERFAGVPEPLPEVVDLAARAGLLTAPSGWRAAGEGGGGSEDGGGGGDGGAAMILDATLAVDRAPHAAVEASAEVRLLLEVEPEQGPVHLQATPLDPSRAPLDLVATVVTGTLQKVELPARAVHVTSREPVRAAWLVPHAPEIPPPPPRPWRPN